MPDIRWIRTEIRGMAYTELWGMMSPIAASMAWVIKFLRIPAGRWGPVLPVHLSHADAVVPERSIPWEIRADFGATLEAFQCLGFEGPSWQSSESRPASVRIHEATLRHRDGRILGHAARIESPTTGVHQFATLWSELTDGRCVTTTDLARGPVAPPGDVSIRRPGASMDELWAAHERAVEGREVTVVADAATHAAVIDRSMRRKFDWHVARGAWREVPEPPED